MPDNFSILRILNKDNLSGICHMWNFCPSIFIVSRSPPPLENINGIPLVWKKLKLLIPNGKELKSLQGGINHVNI